MSGAQNLAQLCARAILVTTNVELWKQTFYSEISIHEFQYISTWQIFLIFWPLVCLNNKINNKMTLVVTQLILHNQYAKISANDILQKCMLSWISISAHTNSYNYCIVAPYDMVFGVKKPPFTQDIWNKTSIHHSWQVFSHWHQNWNCMIFCYVLE